MAVDVYNPLLCLCAGPNCGKLRMPGEAQWWLLWTERSPDGAPVFAFRAFNEDAMRREIGLPVCGDACAHNLLSQFIANIRESQQKQKQPA